MVIYAFKNRYLKEHLNFIIQFIIFIRFYVEYKMAIIFLIEYQVGKVANRRFKYY